MAPLPSAGVAPAVAPAPLDEERVCERCGCSDHDPCSVYDTPCCWIKTIEDRNVCSACAGIEETAGDPDGRRWLITVANRAASGMFPPYTPCLAACKKSR